MSKNKIIVSAVGMGADQLKRVQEELNDPNTDQYVWVFDKPVTTHTVSNESGFNYSDVLYGWDIHRVFRDTDKNILTIVLTKDGVFKEYKLD